MYVHYLTCERISIDTKHMRAREKRERYFCNPHTSGTRKRRPIFRYGQVGGDSFNSCSFHLAPSLQVPVCVPVPVSATFSVSRGTGSSIFAEETRASDRYQARKFRGSIPRAGWTTLCQPLSPLLFSFAPAIPPILLPGRALLRCASRRLSCGTIRRYIFLLSLTKLSYFFRITGFT